MFNLKITKLAKGPTENSGPGGSKPFGRKRIKDRGINWEEKYGERSDDLKRRMEDKLGYGAYMRWEGHDYTTNGDYFVVVGPAVTKDEKKKFFSGIKRLPDDPDKLVYSPSGEYFNDMRSALSHASEKWGVPMPKDVPNYTIRDLAQIKIPRHIKG